MTLGEVCIHGSLKRQCETCEIADERDLWKAKAEKLAEALDDFIYGRIDSELAIKALTDYEEGK